jgi:hypothetical protein
MSKTKWSTVFVGLFALLLTAAGCLNPEARAGSDNRPLIDRQVPTELETASFALG